jgi:2-oxoglutarate ferredoxin oxidoreductase subunit beta
VLTLKNNITEMNETAITSAIALTPKDFVTDQEVRWCPGCGDYSILAQVQKIMPTLGIPRENNVIISRIC